MPKSTSFAAAMNDFFGRKPGQQLSDFMTEMRQLSPTDKEFFTKELTKAGYAITPLPAQAA